MAPGAAAAASHDDIATEEMGEYERQRAMHVARNAEYMRRLGVGGGVGGLAALLSAAR